MTEDKKPKKETSTRKEIGKRPRKKQSGCEDKVGNGRSGGGDKTGNGIVGGDKADLGLLSVVRSKIKAPTSRTSGPSTLSQ